MLNNKPMYSGTNCHLWLAHWGSVFKGTERLSPDAAKHVSEQLVLNMCSSSEAQETSHIMNIKPVFNYFATIKAENSTEHLIYIWTFYIYVNKHLLK